MGGAAGQRVYEACCTEGFCLVTLDLDFSNVIRFPPELVKGIAVIRISQNPSLRMLESLIRQFLQALEKNSIEKNLWIVEAGRIRIHQSDEE